MFSHKHQGEFQKRQGKIMLILPEQTSGPKTEA